MTRIVSLRDLRIGVHGVDHRDGSGHLNPAYEVALRARVLHALPRNGERAFLRRASSADPRAEQSGEEFVRSITSGEEGGAPELDETTSEERGGPFVITSGRTEFAYDSDDSNPADGTREPFPTT